MPRTTSVQSRPPKFSQYAPSAATLALVLASGASAGLIGPGGDVHNWLGAVNSSWNVGGNWTGGAVPGNNDAAIVNGGPFNNILLNADSATLTSLFVSGSTSVSNNGFRLRVTAGTGTTTAIGLDSSVFVAPAPGGIAGFETDVLELQNESRLLMSGGRAQINGQFTMSSDAVLSGHGVVQINSANPVAFSGLGGEAIFASGGLLTLNVAGGGAIALPPTLNLLAANSALRIQGPLFLDVNDVNMRSNTDLWIDEPWTLAGVLDIESGAGTAHIRGGTMTVEGTMNLTSSDATIESAVSFASTAAVAMSPSSALTIDGPHTSASGHTTSVQQGGILRITGVQGGAPAWSGDVSLSAATLEVNGPQTGSWRMAGDLTLGSLFGLRSSIDGDATIRLTGDLLLPGLGGFLNTTLDLRSGSTMNLANASTRLIVNGDLIQRTGAHAQGNGGVQIMPTGSMLVYEPVDLDVNIENAGRFDVAGDGVSHGYVYINGGYTQTETGRLTVQIAGETSMLRDVYETNFGSTLAGELRVELVGGYVPMIGDTFDVFSANGGITGAFDTLAGDPGFEVSYTANTVILTYVGTATCPADLDGDGTVSASDLAALLAGWGNPGDSDLDGSGTTNASDLAILLAAWGPCN